MPEMSIPHKKRGWISPPSSQPAVGSGTQHRHLERKPDRYPLVRYTDRFLRGQQLSPSRAIRESSFPNHESCEWYGH
jgi:hypothetical protein